MKPLFFTDLKKALWELNRLVTAMLANNDIKEVSFYKTTRNGETGYKIAIKEVPAE